MPKADILALAPTTCSKCMVRCEKYSLPILPQKRNDGKAIIMKALYLKYKDFIMEVIHFGMVGVINTFLGWVIMAVLYNLIHMNYWLSSGISYFIGSVFSYHANAKLTFKVENRDKWLPWRFALNIIVCYLVSFSVAQPLVGWLLDVSGLAAGGAFSQALFENIAMIFGMGIFIVMNFFGQKLFVFRTGKHKKER